MQWFQPTTHREFVFYHPFVENGNFQVPFPRFIRTDICGILVWTSFRILSTESNWKLARVLRNLFQSPSLKVTNTFSFLVQLAKGFSPVLFFFFFFSPRRKLHDHWLRCHDRVIFFVCVCVCYETWDTSIDKNDFLWTDVEIKRNKIKP